MILFDICTYTYFVKRVKSKFDTNIFDAKMIFELHAQRIKKVIKYQYVVVSDANMRGYEPIFLIYAYIHFKFEITKKSLKRIDYHRRISLKKKVYMLYWKTGTFFFCWIVV